MRQIILLALTLAVFQLASCKALDDGLLPREVRLVDHRIVGGHATTIENHPHQLSLQQYNSHICGASVISSKWAVTAGHCVGGSASNYKLRAGSTTKNGGTAYAVKRIMRHPKYNSNTIDYDIAVIEIEGEFALGKTVKPVKLATAEPTEGRVVSITGWGTTSQGGYTSNTLLEVNVPVVERAVCAKAYGSMNAPITDRMICAGLLEEGGKDACQGDSGGPLTANGVLYGVVSWGYGCARPKYPGVYTNVAALTGWVKEQTGSL
ncbi:trypsin alpha-3 [Cephus cinctus]|uniref:trypsin n=1 Tax=Cephus cinctus TaxID=211228 RepID=A0AAJ7CEG5_CEPCN|nr:trypsin alpha-3 [Cephus cinctus]